MSSSPKNHNLLSIVKNIVGLSFFLTLGLVALQEWGIHSDFLPAPLPVHATSRPTLAHLISNPADQPVYFTEIQFPDDNKTTQASADPEKFSARLDSLKGQTDAAAVETRQVLIRRWAGQNPAAAAAWLAAASADASLFQQVGIAWAGSDLPAAAKWVRQLSVGPEQQAAMLALAYEAARTKPVAALELARTLPPTDERDRLLIHAVSQWATADSAAATTWVEKISEPPLRENLLAAVAVALGKQDGAAAAALAATALPAGELQNRTAVAVVQRWTQSAPQSAAAWVEQFPAGPVRDTATENLQSVEAAHNQTALTTPQ